MGYATLSKDWEKEAIQKGIDRAHQLGMKPKDAQKVAKEALHEAYPELTASR